MVTKELASMTLTGTAGGDGAVASALSSIMAAQVERARLYAKFDLCFKRMLEARDDGTYAGAVPQLTDGFAAASRRVLRGESALRAAGAVAAAAQVRRLQEAEKRKLHATVSVHALRKAHAFGSLPWQADASGRACCGAHIAARADGGGAVGSGGGVGGARGVLAQVQSEVLEEHEWRAAYEEGTAQTEEAVHVINDVVEELRYLLAEEAGAEC